MNIQIEDMQRWHDDLSAIGEFVGSDVSFAASKIEDEIAAFAHAGAADGAFEGIALLDLAARVVEFMIRRGDDPKHTAQVALRFSRLHADARRIIETKGLWGAAAQVAIVQPEECTPANQVLINDLVLSALVDGVDEALSSGGFDAALAMLRDHPAFRTASGEFLRRSVVSRLVLVHFRDDQVSITRIRDAFLDHAGIVRDLDKALLRLKEV